MTSTYKTLNVTGVSSRNFRRAIAAALEEAEVAWQERGMFRAAVADTPTKNFTAHLERLDIQSDSEGERFLAKLKVSFLLPRQTHLSHIRRIDERL